ncbi:MAG: MraY family glycosyltransferase [Pseudomonadales bacterium]|jgi:UDP-GlcNAc:undecaprenyl-phosphate GlcNAc-1-phosphate transferase|nr:MraY family glycosyltransferase [Pseudomonadales bacterium]
MDIDLITPAMGALLTLVLLPLLAPVARHFGHVDAPDGVRKLHEGEIPLTGGIALFVAMSLGYLLNAPVPQEGVVFVAVCAVMVLLGALDDRLDLRPSTRLLTELAIAGAIVGFAGLSVTTVGDLFAVGPLDLGTFGPVFTILAVAAAVNAMNMLDGIDGQAACIAWVAIVAVVASAVLLGGAPDPAALALLGGLPIFLAFNLVRVGRRLPKTFLGDSGAKLLGLVLAWELIGSAQGSAAWLDPVTVLWFAAIPLFDTLFVMSYRMLHRRSPLSGDRNHIHHLLLDLGLSGRATLALVTSLAALLAAAGIGLELLRAPEGFRFAALCAVFLCHGAASVALVHARRRRTARLFEVQKNSTLGRGRDTGEFARLPRTRSGDVERAAG